VGLGANAAVTSQVSEWQRTSPLTVTGALFYASVAGVVALAWRARGRLRVAWPGLLWLAVLAAVGAWTVRGLAWWPLGAAVGLVGLLPARALVARPARVNLVNGAAVAVLTLAIVLALPWWRPVEPPAGRAGLLSYAPSSLAGALRSAIHPGDRLFAPQPWASWLEWAVPDAAYFVDSRIELFPASVWTEYETIAAGRADALAEIDARGIRIVVVDATNPALRDGLLKAGWVELYSDQDGAILERPG